MISRRPKREKYLVRPNSDGLQSKGLDAASESWLNGGGEQGRQYCIQKCLLWLIKGDFLAKGCPNVALHTGRNGGARHPVDYAKWLQLLYKQLEQSLDDGITRLWKEGALGVLFQVTLFAYGYTFVSKGTVQAFIDDLKHEAAVYERLQLIQGNSVPVFWMPLIHDPWTRFTTMIIESMLCT